MESLRSMAYRQISPKTRTEVKKNPNIYGQNVASILENTQFEKVNELKGKFQHEYKGTKLRARPLKVATISKYLRLINILVKNDKDFSQIFPSSLPGKKWNFIDSHNLFIKLTNYQPFVMEDREDELSDYFTLDSWLLYYCHMIAYTQFYKEQLTSIPRLIDYDVIPFIEKLDINHRDYMIKLYDILKNKITVEDFKDLGF